jgi:CBS domain-containing protein
MVKSPESLPRTAPVAAVLNKMSVGGFRHVPIVDTRGRPVFVVSMRDVVEYLVDSFPTEIVNLPPEDGPERYQTRDGA